MQQREKYSTIEAEEKVPLPIVWFIVIGLVVAGIIANVVISSIWGGGLVVWPFVFAVAVLLIINDAASQNAVGIPPLQAYGFFAMILIAFFLFVALVSTINPYVVLAFVAALAVFLARDWAKRKARDRELDRRRAAGLCVRCETKVDNAVDASCPQCGLEVNAERLSLLRLGRAMANKDRTIRARQVLTGTKPGKVQATAQRLQQQSAYRYKRK